MLLPVAKEVRDCIEAGPSLALGLQASYSAPYAATVAANVPRVQSDPQLHRLDSGQVLVVPHELERVTEFEDRGDEFGFGGMAFETEIGIYFSQEPTTKDPDGFEIATLDEIEQFTRFGLEIVQLLSVCPVQNRCITDEFEFVSPVKEVAQQTGTLLFYIGVRYRFGSAEVIF